MTIDERLESLTQSVDCLRSCTGQPKHDWLKSEKARMAMLQAMRAYPEALGDENGSQP